MIKYEENSFDLIRYFSAFSVMFLHYSFYGIILSGTEPIFLDVLWKITKFFPGVIILFAMSGFLISASFERCKTKKEFFLKRVFRLYPELWVCTLVNFLVIVILYGKHLDGSIVIWVLTQIPGIANTPSCLDGFATGSVNGVLWTIFTEVQLYVFLGIFYPWLKKLRTGAWSVVLAGSVLLNLGSRYVADSMGGAVAAIIERTFFPYLLWFVIGIFCYVKKGKAIPIIKKYLWFVWLIFAVNKLFKICEYGYYEDILTSLTLPLVTIGTAYVLPKIRIKVDLTYGIFLYHWIVINVMYHLGIFMKLSWFMCFLIFVTSVMLLAWASWYWIGRNLKKQK